MILESNPAPKTVLVCQGTTCSPSGADKVLAVFQAQAPPEVTIVSCGCLGQCGNGPMVLILPEKTWYGGVDINTAKIIVEQHLCWGKSVPGLLYPQLHQLSSSQEKKKVTYLWVWLFALSVTTALVLTIVWVLNANHH